VGEQPGLGALALDQCVGEERRGMNDATDLLRLRARLLQDLPRAFERTARRIVGRRALLPDDGATVARIVDDEIGESSPDVDAEGKWRTHTSGPLQHNLMLRRPEGPSRSMGHNTVDPTLRDASLRDAPQGEEFVFTRRGYCPA
jgi:hypothetical protein